MTKILDNFYFGFFQKKPNLLCFSKFSTFRKFPGFTEIYGFKNLWDSDYFRDPGNTKKKWLYFPSNPTLHTLDSDMNTKKKKNRRF